MKSELNGEIANQALHLAMEWGEHWLCPVQERLASVHPQLTRAELDHYNEVAQQAMRRGHRLVAEVMTKLGWESAALRETWLREMITAAPWASEKNLGSLFSQGMYYAMK